MCIVSEYICNVIMCEVISYVCLDSTSCGDGDVRLRDGFDPSNGRVEYCRHRTWGTVCSNGWDDNGARVVCRQLGYNPDGSSVYAAVCHDRINGVVLNAIRCRSS